MNPLVSIVVATFKRDYSLERALESLAQQSYNNIEIVLVDDNKENEWNEKVLKITRSFKEKYSQIPIELLSKKENQGSAKARNDGIFKASGEFITFLDDDDIYLPEKIENQVNHMLETGADYSITDLNLYNNQDKLIDERSRKYIKKYDSKSLLQYHFKHHMTGTDTMMFTREYITRIGGFDEINVGDEFYLMKKAIEGEGTFSYLRHCDVKAYIHANETSLSSGEGKITGENDLYEYKKLFFPQMDKKTIRYINMRHYAVLAFAFLRMKKYKCFVTHAIKAAIVSPIDCIKLLVSGE